jgi:urea transport system permease protein
MLGALFVLVTIWLPKGILGTLYDFWARRRPNEEPDAKPASVPQPAE